MAASFSTRVGEASSLSLGACRDVEETAAATDFSLADADISTVLLSDAEGPEIMAANLSASEGADSSLVSADLTSAVAAS